jgi:hypothetical protein
LAERVDDELAAVPDEPRRHRGPGDEDEGRALKQWIVAHQSDESAKAALQACDVYLDAGKKPNDHAQPGEKPDCAAPASGKPDTVAAAKARKARVARRPAT